MIKRLNRQDLQDLTLWLLIKSYRQAEKVTIKIIIRIVQTDKKINLRSSSPIGHRSDIEVEEK